ncbi:DUF402 domain-containing protein, partial [Kitasatospora sp. NPDC047058]|uniref:DUF402 domain-containing protein n=1 Tax=Kitasatospora sp. NPDC047058 TaxID=3155620 RepID=UPI003407000C
PAVNAPTAPGAGTAFTPGTTVVRRDVHRGRVWSAQPYRALTDTGSVLHLAYWPGIRSLAPATWAAALRTGDDSVRKGGLHDLAAGTWDLAPWHWRDTVVRSRFEAGEWFSLHYFQDPADGAPLRLYVNFERPVVRTGIGIDTLDLLVDLVVAPDLSSARWKDEDEYAQGPAARLHHGRRSPPGGAGQDARPRHAPEPLRAVRRPVARLVTGHGLAAAGPARRCRPGRDAWAARPVKNPCPTHPGRGRIASWRTWERSGMRSAAGRRAAPVGRRVSWRCD